jgi:hypothetical protein
VHGFSPEHHCDSLDRIGFRLQINLCIKQVFVRQRMTVLTQTGRRIWIVVPSQEMVIYKEFAAYAAENHGFGAAAIQARGPLATEPLAQFGFPPRCSGWISRGPHAYFSCLAPRCWR